jgi:hypothetical protein
VRDTTDHAAAAPVGVVVALIAGLHVLCCGLPLLLLSGVSLATIFPSWPVIAVMIALRGIGGVTRYLRKGCATCIGTPKRQPLQ